ncbi:hypothetical protein ASG89_16780 [Paenibacillus sp. Soil766]|uniref:MFS transporter n=1 Tax=Paenibacillus sp. Soil766 TaxID=1736404 RepID=UPI0007107651|nr:MFS transporter [Paenibacillus sp. Soil766]KRF08087.1 hypothetical protein ASG89_16780 [Paenibacillus sp. Soil766]
MEWNFSGEKNVRYHIQRVNFFNTNVLDGQFFYYLEFNRNDGVGRGINDCWAYCFLPQAILGPFIGVWLDRWNRKKTMILADSAIAFFSLILGIYFFFGEPSLGVVYVILMIRSTASAFHAPAFQAAIPLIAPEDQLTRVAGWHQMVDRL